MKFHKFYDGLIGYETLADLNANVMVKSKKLQSPSFSINLHDKVQSCIKPFFLEPLTKIVVEIPVNIDQGQFYIKPVKIQDNVYIQEGIYKTSETSKACVEIINESEAKKEIFLVEPITVQPINEFNEINFQSSMDSEPFHLDDIESKLKIENLNLEERKSIVVYVKNIVISFTTLTKN